MRTPTGRSPQDLIDTRPDLLKGSRSVVRHSDRRARYVRCVCGEGGPGDEQGVGRDQAGRARTAVWGRSERSATGRWLFDRWILGSPTATQLRTPRAKRL